MLLLLLAGAGAGVVVPREPQLYVTGEYLDALLLTAESPEGLSLTAGHGAPDKLLVAED